MLSIKILNIYGNESSKFITNCIISLNPNCTGGGGHSQIGCAFSALLHYLFFLWSLADILTPSLRKSALPRLPLQSQMTFCNQRSTRKVRFFFSFCVQNKLWQSEFLILACKSVILAFFCFVFSFILIQMKISNNRNHETIKYITKYIRNS